MSENSIADLIPFLAYLLFSSNSKRIKTNKTKRKYILHIHNIVRVVTSQQLLANKHVRLRDSRLTSLWPSGSLGLVADKTTKNKKIIDLKTALIEI